MTARAHDVAPDVTDPANLPNRAETLDPEPVATEGATPAGVGPARLPGILGRSDAGTRRRTVRRLQRTSGNASVQRILAPPSVQRVPPGAMPATPVAPTNQGLGGVPNAPRPEVARSTIERITEIVGLKEGEGNFWVGPLDEYELGRLWGSFGMGLPDAIEANQVLWNRSKSRGMELSDIPITRQVRAMFSDAVRAVAQDYLDKNEKGATDAQKELGFDKEAAATPEQQEKQKDLEFMAVQVQELKKTKKRIEEAAYVGWAKQGDTPVPAHDPHANAYPVPFVAGAPPPLGPDGLDRQKPDDKPMVPYDEVMAQWKPVSGALIALLDEHPALYAAEMQDGLGRIAGETKDDNPVQAAREALAGIVESIGKTRSNLSGGGLDWRELRPIHRQLMSGDRKQGPLDWSRNYYKEAMKEEIGDYETMKAVEDVGIGVLTAVAFLFAELASGGTATAFLLVGLGATAGQTAQKWENWSQLENAAGSAASSTTALVDKEQVDAAFIDAILQTAFAALDAWQAAKSGAKLAGGYLASRAGAKAAEVGLENFAKLKPWEQLLAVEKGINELGVEGVMRKMGTKDPLALLDHLPKGSAAAERVLGYAALAKNLGKVDIAEALKDLGKVIAEKGVAEADSIVQLAIEQIGPRETLSRAGGWSRLASALGTESAAGKRLLAWRDSIYADLKRYVSEDLGAVVQETGTMGSFTNDLDMSFLGKDAAANRAKAVQFLAARSGLAPNAGALDKMLYIGLFTDPRRMHMFDKFPELAADLSKKAASFEEQLVWTAEYRRVLANNPARGERVLKQMEELGIKPIDNFETLSEKAVDVLSADQDRLLGEIEALLGRQPPDRAGAGPKMLELAQTQAQLNVREGGGYFTGGGVRRFVTEDPKAPFAGYGPGEAPARTGSQEYTAALDQVGKLRQALEKVQGANLAAPSAMIELPGAIKSVAKYGNRFTQVAEQLGHAVPGAAQFERMAGEFDRILSMARGEADVTLQAALRADAEKVLGELTAACATFDGLHLAILRELRGKAGLIGREAVAADIVKATVSRYQWLRFKGILLAEAGSVGRTVSSIAVDQLDSGSGTPATAGGTAPAP